MSWNCSCEARCPADLNYLRILQILASHSLPICWKNRKDVFFLVTDFFFLNCNGDTERFYKIWLVCWIFLCSFFCFFFLQQGFGSEFVIEVGRLNDVLRANMPSHCGEGHGFWVEPKETKKANTMSHNCKCKTNSNLWKRLWTAETMLRVDVEIKIKMCRKKTFCVKKKSVVQHTTPRFFCSHKLCGFRKSCFYSFIHKSNVRWFEKKFVDFFFFWLKFDLS